MLWFKNCTIYSVFVHYCSSSCTSTVFCSWDKRGALLFNDYQMIWFSQAKFRNIPTTWYILLSPCFLSSSHSSSTFSWLVLAVSVPLITWVATLHWLLNPIINNSMLPISHLHLCFPLQVTSIHVFHFHSSHYHPPHLTIQKETLNILVKPPYYLIWYPLFTYASLLTSGGFYLSHNSHFQLQIHRFVLFIFYGSWIKHLFPSLQVTLRIQLQNWTKRATEPREQEIDLASVAVRAWHCTK